MVDFYRSGKIPASGDLDDSDKDKPTKKSSKKDPKYTDNDLENYQKSNQYDDRDKLLPDDTIQVIETSPTKKSKQKTGKQNDQNTFIKHTPQKTSAPQERPITYQVDTIKSNQSSKQSSIDNNKIPLPNDGNRQNSNGSPEYRKNVNVTVKGQTQRNRGSEMKSQKNNKQSSESKSTKQKKESLEIRQFENERKDSDLNQQQQVISPDFKSSRKRIKQNSQIDKSNQRQGSDMQEQSKDKFATPMRSGSQISEFKSRVADKMSPDNASRTPEQNINSKHMLAKSQPINLAQQKNQNKNYKLSLDKAKQYDKETNAEEKGQHGNFSNHVPDSPGNDRKNDFYLPPINNTRSVMVQDINQIVDKQDSNKSIADKQIKNFQMVDKKQIVQNISKNQVQPEKSGPQIQDDNKRPLKKFQLSSPEITKSLKRLTTGDYDFLKSLRLKTGYKDLIIKDGKAHVNEVTLKKWLGKELTQKEVQNGLKRIYDKYPLYNFGFLEVFPIANQIKKSIKKACCKSNLKKLNTDHKVHVSSTVNLATHIQQKILLSVKNLKDRQEIDKLVELEPKILNAIQYESECMDQQNKVNNVDYQGTDPKEDGQCLYKYELLKKLHLKEVVEDGQVKYFSKEKVVNRSAIMEVLADLTEYKLQKEDDPYNIFGHGILAFFRMIQYMICTFIIISLLASTIMYLYSTEMYSQMNNMGLSDSLKLSNLDGAESHCDQQYWLKVNEDYKFKCNGNKIHMMLHVGIIPNLNQADPDYQTFMKDADFQKYNDFCGHPHDHHSTDIVDNNQNKDKALQLIIQCSKGIDHKKLISDFNKQCQDKASCQFNLKKYIFNNKTLGDNYPRQCQEDFAKVFFQYKCYVGDEKVKYHQYIGLYISEIAVLIGLVYCFIIYYLRKTSKLNMKLWDFNTVTSGDFTVQINLSKEMWLAFQDQQKQGKIDKNLHFKDYLSDQIIKQMMQFYVQLPTRSTDEKNFSEKFKIAAIFLAYDNKRLINLLIRRGKQLSQANHKQAIKYDRLIMKLTEDPVYKERLRRPVVAFVTFNDQEDQALFLELFETKKHFLSDKVIQIQQRAIIQGEPLREWKQFNLFGYNAHCKEAYEPSSYHWENLQNNFKYRLKRYIASFFLGIMLLIFIMSLVLLLKSQISKGSDRFPSKINQDYCTELMRPIKNETNLIKQFVKLDKYFTMGGDFSTGVGYYQCYCNENKFQDIRGFWNEDNPCSEYNEQFIYATLFQWLVSILIVVLNIIIKQADIKLVKNIGMVNKSQEISFICISIFISQYFNTALVLTLSYSNILPSEQNRGYRDFDHEWYNVVGNTFVTTMSIQAFMPYFGLTQQFITLWVKRYFDSGSIFIKDLKQTKTKTIQQFVDKHTGPEQQLHYRYATIMNQVFVTFTYGLSMPIMFPILTVSLVNMYICERLQFAFLYRKPPLLDNKLNDLALWTLSFAPCIMFLTGFWQFGNRQIFFDKVKEKERLMDNQNTDHFQQAFSFFTDGADHTAVFFFYIFFFMAFHKIIKYIRKVLRHCRRQYFQKKTIDKNKKKHIALHAHLEGVEADDMNIDENLDKYWQCIPGQDQKRWFTKESHLRKQLNIKQLDDENYQRLQNSKRGQHFICNTINYDILFDQEYADKMFYTNMGRRVENESSDAICQLLYQGEKVADNQKKGVNSILYSTKNHLVEQLKTKWKQINKLEDKEHKEGSIDDDHSDMSHTPRAESRGLQSENLFNFELDIDGFE